MKLTMRKIRLGNTKEEISVIGQGSYGIFQNQSQKTYDQWIEVFNKGIELGLTHIDTAELYGSGKSEEIVGKAIKGYEREDLFITTKMLPKRTTKKEMQRAIDKSLQRLGLDYVDLYLIHWLEADSSIEKIIQTFEEFVDQGKTRFIGVSNFSKKEFKKAQNAAKKYEIVTNQIEINIKKQGPIHNDLKFYKNENVLLTAYTPLAKGNYSHLNLELKEALNTLASKHNATKEQIALAWLINHENVITIPRTSNLKHLKKNAKANEIKLSKKELENLYLK
ncbi:MAG: aldo/keto reductase [Candidatus Lokiarchaeota archaeon]|nr:aldo/keto reductase [Candidatus Lokiarchaeota archaeon]